MNNNKSIILNNDQIEKFNDYSCNLGTLKRALNITIEYIENEDMDVSCDVISLLYVLYSYLENLKKNFTEFLNECNILL